MAKTRNFIVSIEWTKRLIEKSSNVINEKMIKVDVSIDVHR